MTKIRMTVDSLSRSETKKNKKVRETKQRQQGKKELKNTESNDGFLRESCPRSCKL